MAKFFVIFKNILISAFITVAAAVGLTIIAAIIGLKVGSAFYTGPLFSTLFLILLGLIFIGSMVLLSRGQSKPRQ